MKLVRLGDVCEVVSGSTPKSNIPEYWDGEIKWITPAELNDDSYVVYDSVRHITDLGVQKTGLKPFPAGTVILSSRAPIGKTAIAGCEMYCNQGFKNLICSEVIDNHYLYHYLSAKTEYLKSLGRGATFKEISKSIVENIEIPLPSLEEQRKLADQFEQINQLISLRKMQIYKLDQLVKSRFVEMFGDPNFNPMAWPIEALGGLLSVEPQNGLYKPQSDYVQDGTGIPILRIDAFYDGKVANFSGLKRLICTNTEKNRYLLKENDIVINRVNSIEYLGKCAWITGIKEPTVFESNMMRFHVDESRIDPCYMTRLLCSDFIYNQILNRAKKAVNQASINQGDVQSFSILVPPIELQKRFAAFVAQVDKSKFDNLQTDLRIEIKSALFDCWFSLEYDII